MKTPLKNHENPKIFGIQKNPVFLDKKAQLSSETIFWIWRFVMIVVFAGSVILVTWAHSSKPVEIRDIESAALASKTLSCIKPDLYFDSSKFNNAIENCLGLPKSDENEIFINATLSDFDATKEPQNFGIGLNKDIGLYCDLESKNVELAVSYSCSEFRYYVVSKEGSQYIISLKIGIKKT